MEEEAGLPKGAWGVGRVCFFSLSICAALSLNLLPSYIIIPIHPPSRPPAATIAKLAKDILARSSTDSATPPPRLTPDGVAAAAACASEFVRLLAGEAAEAATKAGRNMIAVRVRVP